MRDILKSIKETEIDTVLAEDIDFTGELSFDKTLMIKGKVQGDIQATGDLYIGPNAEVIAEIQAQTVSLEGSVTGNIQAISKVELYSSAAVDGDITAPDIIMESGCRFNGKCTMTQPEEKGEIDET